MAQKRGPRSIPLPAETDDPVEEFVEGLGELLYEQEDEFDPEQLKRGIEALLRRRPAPPRIAGMSAQEQAQALIGDAWDAEDDSGAELVLDALRLFPNSADAYVYLAHDAGSETELAFVLFTLGMMAGVEALGTETFARHAGDFWGIVETRPFMRAMEGVGHASLQLGDVHAATECFREMLRLNPGDNQGVRYALMAIALESDDRALAAELFGQYDDEVSPPWDYGRALTRFREEGDNPASRLALGTALVLNGYLPAYLLGEKRLPANPPLEYSPGTASEAACFAADLAPGWQKTHGALEWLRAGREAKRRNRRAWFEGME